MALSVIGRPRCGRTGTPCGSTGARVGASCCGGGGPSPHRGRRGRYLSRMPERIRTRFLVVGSGVAGLQTAWRASASGEVAVLTKRSLFDSATAYAQGGIAAALGAGDSPELHRRDTLAAGAALCDADA